jgi:hypothetical protein
MFILMLGVASLMIFFPILASKLPGAWSLGKAPRNSRVFTQINWPWAARAGRLRSLAQLGLRCAAAIDGEVQVRHSIGHHGSL